MGIEAETGAQTPPSLTEELVQARFKSLIQATINGNGDMPTALSPLVDKARGEHKKGDSAQNTVDANKEIIGQWLNTKQQNLAEGKDPNAKPQNAFETVMNFFSGNWGDGLLSLIGMDKVGRFADAAFESISKQKSFNLDDIKSIYAVKTQEAKIMNFATRHGLDGERLLAEIKNPPKETEQLAKLTPEEQLQRLTDIAAAKAADAAKQAQAAEDAQVKMLIRMEQAKQHGLQANASGQPANQSADANVGDNKGTGQQGSNGQSGATKREEKKGGAGGKRVEKKTAKDGTDNDKGTSKSGTAANENDGNVKGTKTGALQDAQKDFVRVASNMTPADHGFNKTATHINTNGGPSVLEV